MTIIPEPITSSSWNSKRWSNSDMVRRHTDHESSFDDHTWIDLWCGDWASGGEFVDTQTATKRSSVTVVDQSPWALGQASNTLKSYGIEHPSTVVGNFCEYSPAIYRPDIDGKKLFTIFGQTIGNLSADDVEKLVFLMCINTWYCIFDFCHSINDPQETLKLYGDKETSDNETYEANYHAVVGYLSALGMQPNDIDKIHYHVQRDTENGKVNIGFKTKEDITIHGKVFKKDTPYTLIHSWRRPLSFYEEILKKYGARIEKIHKGDFSTQCVVRLPGYKEIAKDRINDMLSKQPNRKDFMSDIQGRKVVALDTSKAAMYTLKSLGAIWMSILFLIMSLSKPGNNNKRLKGENKDSVTITIPDSSNVWSWFWQTNDTIIKY